MVDEPVGVVEETRHLIYTPIFIGYGEVGKHEHSLPLNKCPYCGEVGQFTNHSALPANTPTTFYCNMCEITWRWECRRKDGEPIRRGRQ